MRMRGDFVFLGGLIGLCMRGMVEIQGLAGRSNGLADYVTFLFVALMLTRPAGSATATTHTYTD
jgi:hypothetical protein